MDREEVPIRMTGGGASRNDRKETPLRMTGKSHSELPSVIPNGVRNPRSPLMACPLLRRSFG